MDDVVGVTPMDGAEQLVGKFAYVVERETSRMFLQNLKHVLREESVRYGPCEEHTDRIDVFEDQKASFLVAKPFDQPHYVLERQRLQDAQFTLDDVQIAIVTYAAALARSSSSESSMSDLTGRLFEMFNRHNMIGCLEEKESACHAFYSALRRTLSRALSTIPYAPRWTSTDEKLRLPTVQSRLTFADYSKDFVLIFHLFRNMLQH